MAHSFAIAPKTGMIDFCEAVVVAVLYGNGYANNYDKGAFDKGPDNKKPAIETRSDKLNQFQVIIQRDASYFVRLMDSYRVNLANWIQKDEVHCYSKNKHRPLNKDDALEMIAVGHTSDILIFAHDLLFGDRYPTNFLSDVVENARMLCTTNVVIKDWCASNTRAENTGESLEERRASLKAHAVDGATTAGNRYTPSDAKREARKLNTQAMYESWQKEYRALKKRRPNMSKDWYSQQIAKMDIAKGRNYSTIKKNMERK